MLKPIIPDSQNTGPGSHCEERNITCSKVKDFACCPTIIPKIKVEDDRG